MRATRLFVLVLMGLTAGSLAQDQRAPDKPLGDVAREQRKLRGKNDSQQIYTNEGGASPKVAADSAAAKTPSAAPVTAAPRESPPVPGPQPAAPDSTSEATPHTANSAADPQEDTSSDVVVIPAGTPIRVEIIVNATGRTVPEEGTVIVSVPAGGSVGIPARSKVILRSTPPRRGDPHVFVAVAAVSIHGGTYAVHTTALPLPASGTNSELTFTLVESLTLP